MKPGWLVVLSLGAFWGCGRMTQPEYDLQRAEQQNTEYERQLKLNAEQMERAAAMEERQDKLTIAAELDLERQRKLLVAYEEDAVRQRKIYDLTERQIEKQDELLKKWELNLERFGRVLAQWEKIGATNPAVK